MAYWKFQRAKRGLISISVAQSKNVSHIIKGFAGPISLSLENIFESINDIYPITKGEPM